MKNYELWRLLTTDQRWREIVLHCWSAAQSSPLTTRYTATPATLSASCTWPHRTNGTHICHNNDNIYSIGHMINCSWKHVSYYHCLTCYKCLKFDLVLQLLLLLLLLLLLTEDWWTDVADLKGAPWHQHRLSQLTRQNVQRWVTSPKISSRVDSVPAHSRNQEPNFRNFPKTFSEDLPMSNDLGMPKKFWKRILHTASFFKLTKEQFPLLTHCWFYRSVMQITYDVTYDV